MVVPLKVALSNEVVLLLKVAPSNQVFVPLKVALSNEVVLLLKVASPNQVFVPLKVAPSNQVGRLRERQIDGSFGARHTSAGETVAWGNAVVGLRNALAPPVRTRRDESGRVWADFHLGAAYEGPPGLVHGGASALILDHVLGEAASTDRKPRFTGNITVRYLRATPLGPLHVEAVRTRSDGVKTYCTGHIADAEGITVEAEGVFITPRWLRD